MFNIGFIGAGNMAEALLKGILSDGSYGGAQIIMSDPRESRLAELNKKYGVAVTVNNDEVAASSETVILAVKPQVASQVLGALKSGANEPLYISILAGLTTLKLEKMFPGKVRLVRAMPNTPALVMKGSTALCRGSFATDGDMVLAEGVFRRAGGVITLRENLMDAAMGISGCGPAYFYMIIEALSDAGVRAGLSREDAVTLAAQTALGSAHMVLETDMHPAALKDMVTSPGGTTIEAVKVLEERGVRAAMISAVEAAIRRSKELE